MSGLDKLSDSLNVCNPDQAPNNWTVKFWHRFWLWRYVECECCKFWRACFIMFALGANLIFLLPKNMEALSAGLAFGFVVYFVGAAAYESYKAGKK